MITEIVFFDLPKNITRDQVMQKYQQTSEKWAKNTDLIQKFYFFDDQKKIGGGVYIWKSEQAARQWHGEPYKQTIQSLYGSSPRIMILDTLIHIDNTTGKILEM